MYLTKQEEKILDGEYGPIEAKAMRILTTLGDIFHAENLIPIESVQIAGISYKTIGDAGLEFLEDWASARVKVESRMNPAGMDLRDWKEMGISEEFAAKQLRIINALVSMGVKKSCTCTPYLAGLVPKKGSHIAWSESSAVIFANSVLGAMTNREGGPSALSAAIIGKTPNYGMHLSSNRIAQYIFKVPKNIEEFEYSLLGYYIGNIAQNEIFALEGLNVVSWSVLKSLGAGAAASGGVPMFMAKNITPEYKISDQAETIDITHNDLIHVQEQLSCCSDGDLITFGCPHCSEEEINMIIQGNNIEKEVWICTTREIKEKFQNLPTNIKIWADTCMVVAPIEDLGIKCIASNSTKCCHYSQNLSKIKTIIKSRKELLNEN